jgi:hypothetical protein
MLRPSYRVSDLVGKQLEEEIAGGRWETVFSGNAPLPLACVAVCRAGNIVKVPVLSEPNATKYGVSLSARSRVAWCMFLSLCYSMHVRLKGYLLGRGFAW